MRAIPAAAGNAASERPRRGPRRRLAAGRYPHLLRPAALARVAAGAALIVALVAVVVTVAREADVERPAAPPGEKVAATDVERGVRFSLDGRVLTVQLPPDSPGRTVRTVSGAEISATCGTNVTAPPNDPRSETTLTRRWPAGETSLSYHFPRDVASWCRLDDQTPSLVAFVRFPGDAPGAKGPIAEAASNWARLFASSAQACNAYTRGTACEQVTCRGCKPSKKAWRWAEAHLTATVQKTAISGDRAAAKLSNGHVLQLRRSAAGEWLIDGFGEDGLPTELRRKL